MGSPVGSKIFDQGRELVPAAGKYHNEGPFAGSLIERPVQHRDALGKAVFIHKTIRPDLLEQFDLAENPTGILN